MRSIPLFVIALLFLTCSKQSFTDEQFFTDEFDLTVMLEDAEISTSQYCVINIIIAYSEEYYPRIPDWFESFAPLEIFSITETGNVNKDNTQYVQMISVTLKQLLPGDYILKPIEIEFTKNGDSFFQSSDYMSLKVTSNIMDEEIFIDQFAMERSQYTYIVVIACSLLLLTAGLLFLWQRNKNKKKAPIEGINNYLHLIEEVSEDWDDKQFYERLSFLLKEYLDQSIFLSVQSLTTEELTEKLIQDSSLDSELKSKIINVLKSCDLLLFSLEKKQSHDKKRQKELTREIIEKINSYIRSESGV